jgi:hypothetical protein
MLDRQERHGEEVRRPDDFEAVFEAAKQGHAQALIAFDDSLTFAYRSQIVALAPAAVSQSRMAIANFHTRVG